MQSGKGLHFVSKLGTTKRRTFGETSRHFITLLPRNVNIFAAEKPSAPWVCREGSVRTGRHARGCTRGAGTQRAPVRGSRALGLKGTVQRHGRGQLKRGLRSSGRPNKDDVALRASALPLGCAGASRRLLAPSPPHPQCGPEAPTRTVGVKEGRRLPRSAWGCGPRPGLAGRRADLGCARRLAALAGLFIGRHPQPHTEATGKASGPRWPGRGLGAGGVNAQSAPCPPRRTRC